MDRINRQYVERAIIDTLTDLTDRGTSDYSTLQDLLPAVPMHEFLMSMSRLCRDGKIKEEGLRKVECFVNVEGTLVSGIGVAIVVSLVEC